MSLDYVNGTEYSVPGNIDYRDDGVEDYKSKVLSIKQSNLILYHLLDEVSGVTATDSSPEGNDGTYSGPTLGSSSFLDGRPCPFFDGTNDEDNFPASFWGDWDDDSFGIVGWARMYNSGVWTDGTTRLISVVRRTTPDSALLQIGKRNTNNTFIFVVDRAGLTPVFTLSTQTTSDWFSYGISYYHAGNYAKCYFNGSLVSTDTTVASNATVDSFARVGGWGGYHHGWIGPHAVWNTPLSDAEHATLGRL